MNANPLPALTALTLGLLLFTGEARADTGYDRCMKTAMSNVDMGECGSRYLARADAALNVAWRKTIALASGKTRNDLLAEQRAWITFKERSCTFYANGDRGREGAVIAFPACRGAIIDARTAALKAIAADLGRR